MDAKMYASGSKDGSIKLWDGVSSKCVNTFKNAHDGNEVSSISFTRNGKVRRKILNCSARFSIFVPCSTFSRLEWIP
jgi:WD40 repeat protein